MSHSHFAIRINDQPSTYLRGTEQEMLDMVTTLLQQMDGVDTWCLSIWRVPKDRSDDDMMVVLVAADADDVGHALKEFLRREDEVPELLVIEVGTEQELRLDGDSPA